MDKDKLCALCNHILTNNSHGLDQNDFTNVYNDQTDEYDYIHTGYCSYCIHCNPRLKEILDAKNKDTKKL